MNRKSQQGIALIITLILLSVITFMAITFLVLSRHGSNQVTTLVDQTRAKQAADQAFEKAAAQIIARMMADNNGFYMPLLVSTNYLSAAFDPASTAITNVNYDITTNLTGLTQQEQIVMLNNLLLSPRAPVYITTNKAFAPDNRFYLDLNRNGIFDQTGPGTLVDQFDFTNFNYNFVGDLQWIGILEHPDQRHSSSNLFVARVAFIALPVGNMLDINSIHNQSKRIQPDFDGFLRNQGVGTWEINMAGFLHGLHSNTWTYLTYDNTNLFNPSVGSAFQDAASILQYRYGGNYNTLQSVDQLYGATGSFAFTNDLADGYSTLPLMTGFGPIPDNDALNNTVGLPWSGADNTNGVFTVSDFYTAQMGPFPANLLAIGTNTPFDRYTFYRMISQLGFESSPESTNKLNLNHVNVGGTNATNFLPWAHVHDPIDVSNTLALQFFTNAADRLLRSQPDLVQFGLSATNIPIYPTNMYTPAVHRMFQMAANIYDATQYKTFYGTNFDYPSVFRPTFGVNGSNIFINGFAEVTTNADYSAIPFSVPDQASSLLTALASLGTNIINVYEVPWVIGARKGFPNFNEISMQSVSQLSRKLEIVKPNLAATASSYHTNVQYVLGISNTVAVELWNSYRTPYTRPVEIIGVDNLTVVLTNENGVIPIPANFTLPIAAAVSNWAGFPNSPNTNLNGASFRIPLYTNVIFLPDAIYRPNGTFTPVTNVASTFFDTTTGFPQPRFGLNTTNRLRFIMLDAASRRVIDYVQLSGMESHRDLTEELTGSDGGGPGGVWDTNRVNLSTNVTIPVWGMRNQVAISQRNPPYTHSGRITYPTIVTASDWQSANVQQQGFQSVSAAVTAFNNFYNGANTNQLRMQVPYTPTRKVQVSFTWQANDPLVHYTLSDLTGLGDMSTQPKTNYVNLAVATNLTLPNIGFVNERYLPWRGRGNPKFDSYPNYVTNMSLKDPMVLSSDDWNFPGFKFPNIGWLGRVHRGTPWQTIYMKSSRVDNSQWVNWTGNSLTNLALLNTSGNLVNYDDADTARPTNDYAVFDQFTTALNDNATRGQASVNQREFATWEAVLAGVIVVTNTNGTYAPVVIDPNPNQHALQLSNIVAGINQQRNTYPGNVFTRVGDILSTPELTVRSPFLDHTAGNAAPINDEAYERIPQQVMSLLRVGSPRYVIFAYGQALKPAPNSRFTGGFGIPSQYTGTVTNYQITAEVATRTVVRFEPSGQLNPEFRATALNPTQNPRIPGFPANRQPPSPRAVVESFVVLPPD